MPISPSVLYVIEVRQRIGEDIELCDKGVLVWIVDGSRRNVDRNAVVQPAGRSYNDDCGAIFDAAFDVGPGQVSAFEDANIRMESPRRVLDWQLSRARHLQVGAAATGLRSLSMGARRPTSGSVGVRRGGRGARPTPTRRSQGPADPAPEYSTLLLTGEEPTEQQRFFLDVLLLSIAEHGLSGAPTSPRG